MPTLTSLCTLCNGHHVVPDPIFGGYVPCPCTRIPASVDPYLTGDGERCGCWFDDDVIDDRD